MNESPFLSGNISPNCPNAWERLKSHHRELSKKSMAELFSSEKGREKKLSLSWEDFFIDLSKNRIRPAIANIQSGQSRRPPVLDRVSITFGMSKFSNDV